MKICLLIPTIFLIFSACTADADLSQITELESMVNTEKIFDGEPDWAIKQKELNNAVKLYESIDNKHLIPDETFKGISIYYFYTGKGKLSKPMLDQYLEKHPQDGEAIFYRGVIERHENKQKFCEAFRKALKLGYKPGPVVMFTMNIGKNECQ